MPFQLNPTKVPIWQTESTLKLGIDETDQVLEAVTTAQERLINLLFQGVSEDHLEVVGDSVGLSSEETIQLIERLRPSLLDQPRRSSQTKSFDSRFAEIIRIGFESNQAPDSVLAQRAESLVLIPQLDRTGLALAKALAETGFRKLATNDYELVSRNDLGELGYPTKQLGIPRLSALREVLAANSSAVEVNHFAVKPKHQPKVVALSGMHRVNPKDFRKLTLPHLSIEYALDELRISGVIRPGETSCLGCRDLWESENDRNWTTTSIQLSARNDQLDDGAGLLMACSIATKTICNFIDSTMPNDRPGFKVNLKTRSCIEYGWQPHPACDCRTRNFERGQ